MPSHFFPSHSHFNASSFADGCLLGDNKVTVIQQVLADIVKLATRFDRKPILAKLYTLEEMTYSREDWTKQVIIVEKLAAHIQELAIPFYMMRSEYSQIEDETLKLQQEMATLAYDSDEDVGYFADRVLTIYYYLIPFIKQCKENGALLYSLLKQEKKHRAILPKSPLQLLFNDGLGSVVELIKKELKKQYGDGPQPNLDLYIDTLENGTI